MFSSRILHVESIDSTNRLLKELALKGEPEGAVVVADEQTAGRGRRGRAWASPKGSNLLVSILLRPPLEPEKAFVLTMVLGVVTSRVVREATGLSALIKWPNDIYLGEKKLAGILTEFSTRGKALEYVILGMGLNVNWHPPPEEGVRQPATSLLAETGKVLSRNELLGEILGALQVSYRKVLQGEIEGFYREWNDLSLILGRRVSVESDAEVLQGKAVRIDEQGALILEKGDGSTRRVLCGDVSLRYEEDPR